MMCVRCCVAGMVLRAAVRVACSRGRVVLSFARSLTRARCLSLCVYVWVGVCVWCVVCVCVCVRAQLVRTLEGHTGTVFAVTVSPDGRFVFSGSADETVRQWQAESGEVRGGCVWRVGGAGRGVERSGVRVRAHAGGAGV